MRISQVSEKTEASVDTLRYSEKAGLVLQGDGTIETRKAILEEQRDLLAEKIKAMQKTML